MNVMTNQIPEVNITVTADNGSLHIRFDVTNDRMGETNKIIAIVDKTTEKYKFQPLSHLTLIRMRNEMHDVFHDCEWATVKVEVENKLA